MITRLILSFLVLLTGLNTFSQHQFNGTWQGTLQVGVELRFVLTVSQDSTGAFQSFAQSPDQSTEKFLCDVTTVSGNSIAIEIQKLHVSFSGTLINDSTITGEFVQGSKFPLTLKKQSVLSYVPAAKKERPQTPKPPYPYDSYDVEYDNANGTAHFGATLTVPKPPPGVDYIKTPEYPAVILISGSGTQDRNSTLMGHQPFLVLADHLSRNGIAVLRIDDRGTGKSKATKYDVTSADYADDISAGMDFLKTRMDIDKTKIGLIGHSEGGIIAPMVAAKRKDVAFLVLWGAPVIGGLRINTEQNARQLSKSGIDSAAIHAFRDLHEKALSQFSLVKDSAGLAKKISEVWNQWKIKQNPAILQSLLVADNSIVGTDVYALYYSLFKIPWMRYFITYNPAVDLAKITVPVLGIIGTRDTQVDARTNLDRLTALLSKNKNYKLETYALASLNHLLQNAQTGEVSEYGELEETIAPAALELITAWILKNK